jgi:hypothetical protein
MKIPAQFATSWQSRKRIAAARARNAFAPLRFRRNDSVVAETGAA